MARPIAETPAIYGEDGKRFMENMRKVDSRTPEERKAAAEAFRKEIEEINKKFNFKIEF